MRKREFDLLEGSTCLEDGEKGSRSGSTLSEIGHVCEEKNSVPKGNGLRHLIMRHGSEVQSETLAQDGYVLHVHVCTGFLVSNQPASSFPSSSVPSSPQQHQIFQLHYFIARLSLHCQP